MQALMTLLLKCMPENSSWPTEKTLL